MEKNTYLIALGVVAIIAIVLGGTLVFGPNQFSSDDIKTAEDVKVVEGKEALSKLEATFTARLDALDAEKVALEAQIAELSTSNADYEQRLAELEVRLAEIEEEEQAVEEALESVKYLIDRLELGEVVPTEELSDRDVDTLFDGEIEFNSDDYDAEEYVVLAGLTVSTNENDYEGNTYLTIPEEGVSYTFTFDTQLDTSLISEDESLIFAFLGEEVEVIDWNENEVTFITGDQLFVEEGEIVILDDGTEVEFRVIGDDFVYVVVGESSKKIYEGQIRSVGGVDVRVDAVIDNDPEDGLDMAIVYVGDDVEVTVENGDEYEANEAFEWVIDANSIGLVLVEEHMSIDEDDDYLALGVGELFSLPNNYLSLRYDGLEDEDFAEYNFELTTKSGNDYVRIKGDFVNDLEDYDKIYANASGFYDEDLESIDETEITLEDSELVLSLSENYLAFDDILLALNLQEILVDNESISSFDETYLTGYGIYIDNPEDSVDDEEFTFDVPEEELEATISVIV